MKRFLGFLVAVGMLLSASAAVFATGQPETASTAGGTGLSGKLDVYAFVGPIKVEWWQDVIKEFNSRYPNVTVNLVANPKVHDQIRPRIVAGDPPDVYFNAGAGRITVDQLYNEGLILQLDDFLNGKNWDGSKTLRDTILSYRLDVLDGKTWGIQLPFHLIGFFYNKDIFAKNGWTPPANFDEFLSEAPSMVAKGVAPMVTTGVYPYYFTDFVLRGAVGAAGGPQAFIDWAELKPGFFTSPVFKDVIKKYQELIDKGYLLKGSEGMNHIQSQMEWVNGKAALVPSGTWIESEMSKDFPAGFQEGIRFIPSFFIDKGVKPIVSPYGSASTIIFKGKNVPAAEEFVRAMYSKKMMIRMTELTNILSNVPDANAEAPKSPAIQSALDSMNKDQMISWPNGGYLSNEVRDTISAQLQALMTKQVTADQFCQNVEAAAAKVRADKSVTFLKAFFPK
ncbi:MAG TPA: extracellular solute-binding protein [Spirochaetia bacterium]|nr:extracellular solute-binding protein [Spirochaetia bacterium]